MERREIIKRVKGIRRGIEMIFNDAAHWNRLHPTQKPIDPDPDGTLKKMLERLKV